MHIFIYLCGNGSPAENSSALTPKAEDTHLSSTTRAENPGIRPSRHVRWGRSHPRYWQRRNAVAGLEHMLSYTGNAYGGSPERLKGQADVEQSPPNNAGVGTETQTNEPRSLQTVDFQDTRPAVSMGKSSPCSFPDLVLRPISKRTRSVRRDDILRRRSSRSLPCPHGVSSGRTTRII